MLILVLIPVVFLIGNYVCYLLKFTKRITKSFCVGFITILSIFQLISYPFNIFNGSFANLVILYLIVIAILLLLSINYLRFEKLSLSSLVLNKNKIILTILIFILVIVQSFLSSYLYHEDDDDAYFITVAATVIETNEVSSDVQFASTGLISEQVIPRSDTATWEYFIAFLSYVFSIKPVILAHTILPLLLIPISYMCMDQVASALIDVKARKYFLLIIILLNFFGGYAAYSSASFLLLRIWQGKAVLVSIIFPILLANCIELIKNHIENNNKWKSNLVFISMILLAGVCTSVIGVYLTPLYYVIIGAPYLISIGLKKAKNILLPIILSLLPCGIFTVISFIQVLMYNKDYMNSSAPDWLSIFKINMLSRYYFILFIIGLIYVCIKGNYLQKLILFASTLFAFLSFLNPLFINFVSQKITGVDVYWRLYWTIPIYYTIAYFISDILAKSKRVYNYASIGILILLLNNMGYFIYQQPLYSKHLNIYKIPNEVIHIVDFINENKTSEHKPNVLFPENLAAKVRQYSTEVVTVWSRWLYQGTNIIPNSDITLSSFYYPLYNNEISDTEYIISNLQKLGIEWVILPYELSISDKRMVLIKSIDNYNIYKTVNIK
jgi:hypothetical protein